MPNDEQKMLGLTLWPWGPDELTEALMSIAPGSEEERLFLTMKERIRKRFDNMAQGVAKKGLPQCSPKT